MNKKLALILCAAVLVTSMAALFQLQTGRDDNAPAEFAQIDDGETPLAAFKPQEGEMLDQVIIGFHDRSQFPGKEKQYDDEAAKILKDGLFTVTDNVYVVKAEDLSKNPTAFLNRFKNSEFINYVEPNYKGTFDAVPNDPNYKSMSAGLTAIGAQAGWDIVTGGGPIVAVVDSGVISTHPDLPKLLPGYSAVAGLSPNTDTVNHGTGVAGTIGCLGNNGVGGVGMNWNANLLPVKVDDAAGNLSVANMAKGIQWAADNGAKVISLSVSTTSDSVTLKNAIDYAYNKGCAIFASTGNDGKNAINYPARYSNVMACGATASGTSRASVSNYGPGMGVVAISSYPTITSSGGYANMGGTSFSTPQVSGLASLVLAVNPNFTPAKVYDLIQQGAKTLGGGYNEQTGYGVIDMGKTLQLAKADTPATPPVVARPATAPVLTLKGEDLVQRNVGDSFDEPGYSAIDESDGDITGLVKVSGGADMAKAGAYPITYTVANKAGLAATATRTIVVNPAPVAEEPMVEEAVIEEEKPATPPVLALNGEISIELTEGDSYLEPGFFAIDEADGDISNLVKVDGEPSTAYAGNYTIAYSVTNQAGLTASAMRLVKVNAAPIPDPSLPQPPSISPIGSDPIVLHLGSDTPYMEQGAMAFDEVDGDISNKVVISGGVDRNVAGIYDISYEVTNSQGVTSSTQRSVWVLAPNTRIEPQAKYTFNEQAKKGDKPVSRVVTAKADGIMELAIEGLNKFSVKVTITDNAGKVVFTENFSANVNRDIQVKAGDYAVASEITDGNGNNKYTLKLSMPEVNYLAFDQNEVPLGEFDAGQTTVEMILIASVVAALALVVGSSTLQIRRNRRR